MGKKKFKDIKTGEILEPQSESVIEEMEKSERYSLYTGEKIPTAPKGEEGENTVKELKAKLDELGIEYSKSAKKADLEALLKEAENKKAVDNSKEGEPKTENPEGANAVDETAPKGEEGESGAQGEL